jgi:hypothetical protein
VSTVKHYYPNHISDNEKAPEENSEAKRKKKNENPLLYFKFQKTS